MTKDERTGWRDLRLSEKHREWGTNVPATDIDYFLEYDNAKACAIIEYKHQLAAPLDWDDPNRNALIDLGDRARVPVLEARYSDDFFTWTITPLNEKAKWFVSETTKMYEEEYVKLLYRIRGRAVPEEILEVLRARDGQY